MTVRMVHQRVSRPLSTVGMKNNGRGFNNNNCKFRLVVGCCEKIMTNNTQPANP